MSYSKLRLEVKCETSRVQFLLEQNIVSSVLGRSTAVFEVLIFGTILHVTGSNNTVCKGMIEDKGFASIMMGVSLLRRLRVL